jgi:RHS repeat-associated protein
MKKKSIIAILFFAGVAVSTGWAGSLITYEYDKYGNCTAVSTAVANGAVLEKSTYTYDAYRRGTAMVESAQTSQSRTWTWSYDRYFGTQGYDPSAHTSKQWRLQIEPAYDNSGNRNVTARWFDANDRIGDEYTGVIQGPGGMYNGPDIEVHHFSYDENGQKQTYTDPRSRVTTYTYDNRNRLWKTTEPLSRITETLYDFAGNKSDVTFPDTKSQHWRDYDAFGQAGRFIDERNNTTNLTFHQLGPMKKLASVTTHREKDGGGTEDQPTTFSYDGLGRPRTVLFPDGSTEVSSYDHEQLASWKTRKDQVKTIRYDARGREVSNSWSDPATPGISRSWDDANRVTTLCNIYSTIDFTYDGGGLVHTEGNSIAGSGGHVLTTYERYNNGSISRIIYPNTLSIRRDYNSRGQLSATGWSDSSNNWLAQFATYNYLPDGKLNYQDYVNGVHIAFGYDQRGFVNQETVSRAGQTYSQRTFYRDTRDRITAFQKGTGSTVNPMENGRGDRFRYDDEGQLVEAWYNAADPANSGAGNNRYDGFNYDALGNRAGANFVANHGAMTFTRKDNGLNQYRGWWNFSVTNYDDDIAGWGAPAHANGVLMQEGNITAGYNALNQPMMINSAATGGNWMFFGYDPLGRCVKRWTGALYNGGVPPPESGPATYLYYDGWSLIQEGPSASAVDRVYMPGNRIDEIVADYSATTGQWLYHNSDARGHCTMLTDSSGNILEQYEYDSFGLPYFYNASGAQMNSSSYGNRFLFTGREWLSDLHLYDYRNRLYQPELGRFMQPDPKEFGAGDYNLYRYCHNDPINRSDPMGLDLRIDSYQPPEVKAAIQAIIDRVSQTAEGAAAIQTMRDSKFDNVILGALPGTDTSGTVPRDGANQNNGVGSGAIMTIPISETTNTRSDGTKETLPPSVTAGHEFGHGSSTNKGSQAPGDPNAKGKDYIKQPSESKSDSIKVENAVRKLEKLKERD